MTIWLYFGISCLDKDLYATTQTKDEVSDLLLDVIVREEYSSSAHEDQVMLVSEKLTLRLIVLIKICILPEGLQSCLHGVKRVCE